MGRLARMLYLALLAVLAAASHIDSPSGHRIVHKHYKRYIHEDYPHDYKYPGGLNLCDDPREDFICYNEQNPDSCICRKPLDRTQRREYNARQRSFIEWSRSQSMEQTAKEFVAEYPHTHERWYFYYSSRAGQDLWRAVSRYETAQVKFEELMLYSPEAYPDFHMPKVWNISSDVSVKSELQAFRKNRTAGVKTGNSTSKDYQSNSTVAKLPHRNSTSKGHPSDGKVQIPGTDKWVKANVTAERLEELAFLVPKAEAAGRLFDKVRDEEKKFDKELQAWLKNDWLKYEEQEIKFSEDWIRKQDEDEKKRKDEEKRRNLCGDKDNSVTFKTTEQAREHMDTNSYIWEIDEFIDSLSKDKMSSGGNTRAELPWPEQYAVEYNWTQVNTVRDHHFDSCRSLNLPCSLFPPSNGQYDCAWFWNGSQKSGGKVGYWVFRVIEGVNHKLTLFSDTLTRDTLNTFLDLGKLNDDFDPPPPTEDPAWKWFKFAFGTVTQFLPGPKLVGESGAENLEKAAELFNVIIDAFDTISEEVKNANTASPITSADLGVALGDIFTSLSNGLLNNLETALGKSEQVENWDKLRSSPSSNMKTPIGRFLDNPIWLLENDADVLQNAMAAAATNVQHKLIDAKLRSENYYLTVDTRHWANCDPKGALHIDYDGSSTCFQLYQISGWNYKHDEPKPATDDFYDMMAKYGLEGDTLKGYYKKILECYKEKGGDGELDEDDAVVPGGASPVCFFGLRTAKINYGSGCQTGAFGRQYNCEHWSSEML